LWPLKNLINFGFKNSNIYYKNIVNVTVWRGSLLPEFPQ